MTPEQRIQRLKRLLDKHVPSATVEIDAPAKPAGSWFVDVRDGNRSFAIELRPKVGFGLSSTPGEGIGEGADELLMTEAEVVDRIAELLRSRASTQPMRSTLQQLREHQRISQVALAEKLGIRQPTISKMERREDVSLETLRRYVEALGGKLKIVGDFGDWSVEIVR